MTGPLSVAPIRSRTPRTTFFDRFAGLTAQIASRPPFFSFCCDHPADSGSRRDHFASKVLGVARRPVSARDHHHNHGPTSLMVALLQNSQTRSDLLAATSVCDSAESR